jgi:hypothetical protein
MPSDPHLIWTDYDGIVTLSPELSQVLRRPLIRSPIAVALRQREQSAECRTRSCTGEAFVRGTPRAAVVSVLHVARWPEGIESGAQAELWVGGQFVGTVRGLIRR